MNILTRMMSFLCSTQKQGKTKIGSEDLLMAIIEEPTSLAMKVLGQLGVDSVEIKYGILNECNKNQ